MHFAFEFSSLPVDTLDKTLKKDTATAWLKSDLYSAEKVSEAESDKRDRH